MTIRSATQPSDRKDLSGDQSAEQVMDERTLTALKGSIEKWEGIVAGTVRNQGPDNCPLCHLFIENDCVGCPVYEKTGATGCDDSPFEDYVHAVFMLSRLHPDALMHARRELKFLRSLLPVSDHQSAGEASEATNEVGGPQ